jgi:hypothetical protein
MGPFGEKIQVIVGDKGRRIQFSIQHRHPAKTILKHRQITVWTAPLRRVVRKFLAGEESPCPATDRIS